jgi:AcrR family transcriptional regulator
VTTTPPPSRVDGRTARRDRNRDSVMDAVIDLFTEGRNPPSAPEVAERSGVSLRSVYRYFDDHDDLITTAMARHVERNEPLFGLDTDSTAPLPDRVGRLLDARLALYAAVADTVRVAIIRSGDIPSIAGQLAARRRLLREQTAELFAPELAALDAPTAQAVLGAVDALTQFEAPEHLRSIANMSIEEIRSTLLTAVLRLLTA